MALQGKTTSEHSRARIVCVMVLMGLAWAGLWARAAQLQVVDGERLTAQALKQHLAAEFERGERGRILDREGRVLATSVTSRSLYARPLEIKTPDADAARIAPILGMSRKAVRRALAGKRNFVWVKRQIGDKAAAAVDKLDLPGLYLTDEYVRLYPYGRLAGQVLGFANVDGTGLEGVEKTFNDRLAGSRAKFVVQRDASGRKLYLDSDGRETDLGGEDVRLSIDAHIQAQAEQALETAVTDYNGKSGTALVVEVSTGQILAMAVHPPFNPNVFRRHTPAAWRNRAALDIFEPGSTLKPFLFAAALQEGLIAPEELIFCENGKWKVGGGTITDSHPKGWLTARKVLRYSSNVGCAKIGGRLGAPAFHGYLERLGFGRPTDLPLPGEGKGLMRPPGAWRELDLATASFGQGVGVTALQMARAYLCLANHGRSMPLSLVLDPSGDPPAAKQVFDRQVADAVLKMMVETVHEDGTGVKARIEGLVVGGKTGTAQKATAKGGYGDEFLASFVALIPGDAPELLILAMVDEPKPEHYGGVVAAPAARQIALRTYAYRGKLPGPAKTAAYPPARGTGGPVRAVAARPSADAADRIPSVKGMTVRRAVEVLARKGVVPVLKGEGQVVGRQRPAAGAPWPKEEGNVFVLWLSNEPEQG